MAAVCMGKQNTTGRKVTAQEVGGREYACSSVVSLSKNKG